MFFCIRTEAGVTEHLKRELCRSNASFPLLGLYGIASVDVLSKLSQIPKSRRWSENSADH